MDPHTPARPKRTKLVTPTPVLVVLWAGFPLVGAGLAWLVRLLSGWAATVPDIPLHGWIAAFASIKEPYGTLGSLLVGGFAAWYGVRWLTRLTVAVSVSERRLLWRSGGRTRRLERGTISAIFPDGDDLVVLGQDTRELARALCYLDDDALQRTLVGYDYPWYNSDPHAEEFRRWVEDMPGLPEGANALMRARAKALDDGKDADAADLRTDLGKLGVVVRETDSRQFLRLIGDRPKASAAEPV